jgi:hypothetical protein
MAIRAAKIPFVTGSIAARARCPMALQLQLLTVTVHGGTWMNKNWLNQWIYSRRVNSIKCDEKVLPSDHRKKHWILSLSLALTFGMGYYNDENTKI